MRTENSFYSSISSIIFNLLTVLLGLLNRKVLISTLGVDYQGASGLFTNILSVLAIADAGVGSAIMYHLYKPVEENNLQLIKSLLGFYKSCYKKIGTVIFVAGLICIPALPYIIRDYSLPYDIWFIYIWFLIDAVCSYFFMYRRAALIANQKNYRVTHYETIYLITSKLFQILTLILFHSFILYLAVMVILRLIENILISREAKKDNPDYWDDEFDYASISKSLKSDIYKKVKGSLYGKFSQAIFNGTDNILLSKYFGLSAVGVISNFQMIITVLQGLCSSWSYSFVSSIGNLLVTSDSDNSYKVFKEVHLITAYLLTVGVTGFACTANDLIAWIFGIEYVVEMPIIYSIAASFFVYNLRAPYDIFKSAAGIIYEDRFVYLIEALVNLFGSIALLYIFGISGIFWGTAISSLVVFCYSYPIYVNRKLFNQSLYVYIGRLLITLILPIVSIFFAEKICMLLKIETTCWSFTVKGIISIIISTLIFVIGYAVWVEETKNFICRIKKLLCFEFYRRKR